MDVHGYDGKRPKELAEQMKMDTIAAMIKDLTVGLFLITVLI